MANHPFKINVVTKDGTTFSHFTSSFARDGETLISSSVMVDKINSIPQVTPFIESDESNGLSVVSSKNFGNKGAAYISASYTHPNTGSIIFTDTETGTDGGLDYYTFYGSKVCSVLGLPEGVPIYTENFKLSDDSNDPDNYISGDAIANSLTVKEGFKMSSQARVRGNLIFDHAFGEGGLLFASASSIEGSLGFNGNDDATRLNIGHITASGVYGARAYFNRIYPASTGMHDRGLFLHFENNDDRLSVRDSNSVRFFVRGEQTRVLSSEFRVDNHATILGGVHIGGITDPGDDNLIVDGDITVAGTVDGRDLATDGTKLDGIEASADVTDATNVTAAGALMDSELTSITDVKALNQSLTTTSSPTFEDVNVKTKIVHSGDTDTHIDFGGDSITFDVGNTSVFDMYGGYAIFNEGGNNVDVRMEGQSGQGGAVNEENLFHLDASLGIVCIGNQAQSTDASRLFQVTGNSATDIVRIFNDGNNENRSGMQIRLGTDDGTGTNEYIMFRQGNETAVGLISATSGVVSYGTFTGVHNASILQSDSPSANVITGMPTSSQYHEYPQGTIVSMVSSSYDGSLQPVSFVVSSSAYQDKRTFGVYLGSHNWDDDQRSHAIDKHLIMSVGDGYVMVCNQNGNIEIGDYITTASGSGGYGCKQSDDLLHNYTVAKACDSVDWSEESTTYKLLACTYHCG